MSDNTLRVAILIYNLLIVSGASYLCAEYGWSLWTIFFAVFMMLDLSENNVNGNN